MKHGGIEMGKDSILFTRHNVLSFLLCFHIFCAFTIPSGKRGVLELNEI
jgi:hypothetical protein